MTNIQTESEYEIRKLNPTTYPERWETTSRDSSVNYYFNKISTMKLSLKTVLKFGAAVLVGAVVFIGSTVGSSSSKKVNNSKPTNGSTPSPGEDQLIIPTTPQEGWGWIGLEPKNELQNVQSVMMKTSQFISTLASVFDSVNKLFTPDPVPRYMSSSTIIL